jgi:hypothetical protein
MGIQSVTIFRRGAKRGEAERMALKEVGVIKDSDLARLDSGADFSGANTGSGLAPTVLRPVERKFASPHRKRAYFRPRGEANHMSAVLVWETMIFQPLSNFWRFMVVFPTTACLELGKETDHQVSASAKSGFSNLTWMRVGWMNPIALRSGYPLTYE